MSKKKREERPRSLAPRIAFLVVCTVGVCLAADLQRLHVNVHTDPDYVSYCAMSERVNCETVAASEYAVYFGMPLAIWGLLGYLGLAWLAISGLRRRLPVPSWPYGILALSSGVASIVGTALFLVSHFVIESVCLVCAGTYAVNFLLLGLALVELRRCGRSPVAALSEEWNARGARGRLLSLVAVAGLVLGGLYAGMPRYWSVELRTGPDGLSVGRTPDGHHWIGAANGAVTVVEYSDYECPHCRRGHAEMRAMLQTEPRLRLIHRNYPLDNNCNPYMRNQLHANACFYARMAHCAGEQQRFWQANDYLFQHGRERDRVDEADLAAAIGVDASRLASCIRDSRSAEVVREDIAAGRALNVRGTPTFVLNGRIYPGGVPRDVLAAALGSGKAAPAAGGEGP